MDKKFDTIIIGASLLGAGVCSSLGKSALMVESGGLVGNEFINAFDERGAYDGEPVTEQAKLYAQIMRERKIMSPDGYIHLAAAMYALCDIIRRKDISLLLYTRVLEYKYDNGEYDVTLFNAQGYSHVRAKRIIDTREAKYIKSFGSYGAKKYLNAVVRPLTDDTAHLIYNPASKLYTYSHEVNIGDDLCAAREHFYSAWLAKSGTTGKYALTLLANTFAYKFDSPITATGENGIIYAPSASCKNLLDAFDRGAQLGGAM